MNSQAFYTFLHIAIPHANFAHVCLGAINVFAVSQVRNEAIRAQVQEPCGAVRMIWMGITT
jgi:hypothetical protein